MALTERDKAILHAVYVHRFLRRDQIAQVFFPASRGAESDVLLSSCNARLQRLFQHGYLARSFHSGLAGTSQAVYTLDRRGAALLAAELGVDYADFRWSPKRRRSELYFREHTLAVNDLWVAFHGAAQGRLGLALGDWEMDGPLLWDTVPDKAARRGYLPVRPDTYFTLESRGRVGHFFAEVDRGTMTNRRFAEKVRAYRLYWKTGAFHGRYRASSFQVLVTAPSRRRLENLRRTASPSGLRRLMLFAVHETVRPETVTDPIWLPVTGDRSVGVLD